MNEIDLARRYIARQEAMETPDIHCCPTALTSTDFDGDAFITTARTLIDLSVVFPGVPAYVRAIDVEIIISDSGSDGSTTGCWFALTPLAAGGYSRAVRCAGLAKTAFTGGHFWIPCTSDGDIYYTCDASGGIIVATLTVYMRIWHYLV